MDLNHNNKYYIDQVELSKPHSKRDGSEIEQKEEEEEEIEA